MNATVLSFHNIQFDIVDRDGQPWLRSPQIAVALGYNRADRVNELYARNADEFTPSMTALVDLKTNGGKQQVRIFSLRGCHLLAMFARTKIAKDFRHWVLDVLEQGQVTPKTEKLTADQLRTLQEAVHARTEGLPPKAKGGAYPKLWGAVKSHFRVPSYRELTQDQFDDALSLIGRLPLEGELLPPEEPKSTDSYVTIGVPADGTFVLTMRNGKRVMLVSPESYYLSQPDSRVITLDVPREAAKPPLLQNGGFISLEALAHGYGNAGDPIQRLIGQLHEAAKSGQSIRVLDVEGAHIYYHAVHGYCMHYHSLLNKARFEVKEGRHYSEIKSYLN